MKKRVLIFWRRLVVVKREEEPPTPSFNFNYPAAYEPAKWGLWDRIKYHVTGKGFPPYVPGAAREVSLRRRVVLLFTRKRRPLPPPPPRPVLARTVVVGAVRTGARREPWRWWMLFTRRGADMNIQEWLEDKRLAWMEWPVTWKFGMGIPGALLGWWFSVQTGWSLRPCLLLGALFGMLLPLIVLYLLEAAVILAIFGIIGGAIYWASPDNESTRAAAQFFGMLAGALWAGVVKLWHAIFG